MLQWADSVLLLRARACRFGEDLDVWVFGCLATGGGALSLFVTSLALGVPFEAASSEALFYLFLAALIPQLIGHTALTWALRHQTPTLVGIATVGEPVIATTIAWAWLGTTIVPGVVAGCAVTMVAILVAIGGARKKA